MAERAWLSMADAYPWMSGFLRIPVERCYIGVLALDACMKVGRAVYERFGGLPDRGQQYAG